MKYVLLVLFALAIGATTHAQDHMAAIEAWKTRSTEVLKQYSLFVPLSKTRALVGTNHYNQSLLDENLQLIELPRHNNVYRNSYNLNLLYITHNQKTGVVDFNGRLIIPIDCDKVWLLKEGIKLYRGNHLEWHSLDGQLLWQKTIPDQVRPGLFWYGIFIDVYDTNNRCGVMDTSGQWRIAPEFREVTAYRTRSQEFILNWLGVTDQNTRRLLLPERSWQSKQTYVEFGPSDETGFWAKKEHRGLFRFYNYNDTLQPAAGAFDKMEIARDEYITERSRQQGLMNLQAKVLLPTEFDEIYSMNNLSIGDYVFSVTRDNWHGIWQGDGWVIPVQYDQLHVHTNGFSATRNDSVFFFTGKGALRAAVEMKPPVKVMGDWAWSAEQPNRAFHCETGWVEVPPGTNLALEDKGYLKLSSGPGAVTLLDPKGKVILKRMQSVRSMSWRQIHNPPVFAYEQGFEGYGWIIPELDITVKPQYESVEPISQGLILAKKQLKYGLVEQTGLVILPFEYEQYTDLGYSDMIFLKKNGAWHCFNPKGQRIFEETYQQITHDHFCWGKTAEGWRLLSPLAKGMLANTAFKSVLIVRDQNFIVPDKGKYGLVNLDGSVVYPFEWDTMVTTFHILWGRKGNQIRVLQSANHIKPFEVTGQFIYYDNGFFKVVRNNLYYLYTDKGMPLLPDGLLYVKMINHTQTPYILAEYAKNNWYLLDDRGHKLHTFEGTGPEINLKLHNAINYTRNGQQYTWLIDQRKEMAISYDVVSSISGTNLYIAFKDLMSPNGLQTKYGIVDENMNIRLPFEYSTLTTIFLDQFIWAKKSNGKNTLFDRNLVVCIPEDNYDNNIKQEGDNLLTVTKDNKVGVYIIDQQKWMPAAMDDISACDVRIPLGKTAFLIRKNGKYGLIDSDCREIVPPVYDNLTNQRGNVLLMERNKQFFLYNTLKEKMSADTLDKVEWAGSGHTIGRQGQHWVLYNGIDRIFFQPGIKLKAGISGLHVILIDQKAMLYGLSRLDGTQVLPIQYDSLQEASPELVYVKKGRKTGLMDLNGKIVVPIEANQIEVTGPIITVRNSNRKWGLFDPEGQQLLPYEFDAINLTDNTRHLIAQKNGKYRYLLLNGQPMHQTEWDFADEYNNGRALVGRNGKYGYIDSVGKEIIPVQFRFADRFLGSGDNQFALVIRDKRVELIDPEGKPYTQSIPEYYKLRAHEAPWETSETMKMTPFRPYMTYRGYVFAKINATKKMGIMNVLGEWLLAPEYDQIIISSNGSSLSNQNIALAYILQNGKWGIVGLDCQVLVQPKYDSIVYDAKKKQFLGMLGGKQVVVEMK